MRSMLAGVALAIAASAGLTPAGAQKRQWVLEDGESVPVLRRFASERAFQRHVERVRAARPEGDADNIIVTGVRAPPANPEITNNQTRGVDEGGIVKQIGRFLVVLQDGRLFSIDLGARPGAPLRLAARVDVYRNPKVAARWYDEMLVRGDRILVTAYNYEEEASEITVLRMAPDGGIKREARYLLSSEDYYSTSNYASRIVGDSLVLYTPLDLGGDTPRFQWPRLQRADAEGEADDGKALLGATQVYAAPGNVEGSVLHMVSVCPLRRGIECRSTGFVGPWMREFYVSPTDAFVWLHSDNDLPWRIDYGNLERTGCPNGTGWDHVHEDLGMVYRLPLDGGPVGVVAVEGDPPDQFAFESRDGRFRALLIRSPDGCVADRDELPLALLDIPLSAFRSSVRPVGAEGMTQLPGMERGGVEHRFIGDWLVYGGQAGWSGDPDTGSVERSPLFAVPLARPQAPVKLALPHVALRVERLGDDALVTGYRNDRGLSLSYVALGKAPRLASTVTLPRRFESEARSHAFNAWTRADGSGVIGIPTTLREDRADRGWSDSESSDLSFVAVARDRTLASAGELAAMPRPAEDADGRVAKGPPGYKCEVSCIDWYGNSRPIFTGGRIFALMGTELVEGELRGGRVAEKGRVDLTGPVR